MKKNILLAIGLTCLFIFSAQNVALAAVCGTTAGDCSTVGTSCRQVNASAWACLDSTKCYGSKNGYTDQSSSATCDASKPVCSQDASGEAICVESSGQELKESCKLVKAMTWKGNKCGGTNSLETVPCGTTGCSFTDKTTVGPCGSAAINKTPDWGMVCMVNTVNNVTNWLFYLMTVVAVLLFIIGGVFYMASAGDPEKAKKGKTIIIYAIIGLVIALLAKMIPSLVTTVLA